MFVLTTRSVRLALATLALGAAAAASAQPLSYSWGHPLPQGNPLHDLAFPSASRGYAVGSAGTVLRTDDGGASWSIAQFASLGGDLFSVVADGSLVIAVGEGIYRSTDGGDTFATIANPATGSLRDVVEIPGGGWSAAGENGEVVVSTDGGLTWTETGPGVGLIRRHVWRSATDAWAAGVSVAHRTTDGGQTWAEFLTPPFFGFNDVFFSSPMAAHVEDDFGFGTSTDGGATWTYTSAPIPPLYRFCTVVASPMHWFLTAFLEGGELHETTDGGQTWTQRFDRFVLGFPSVVITPGGRLVWCSDAGDLFWSDDDAQTVHAAHTNLAPDAYAPIALVLDRGDGTVFAANMPNSGTFGSTWFRSDDGGRSWNVPADRPNVFWALEGAFASASVGVVGSYDDVEFTTDGGETWDSTTLPSTQGIAEFAAPAEDRLFVGTYSTSTTSGVYRSTDFGATWNTFGSGLPASLDVQTLYFLDTSRGFVGGTVGSSSLRLYRTTDGGGTWTQLPAVGLPGPISDSWWASESDGLTCVRLGDDPGIYRTTDGGSSWAPVSTLAAKSVEMSGNRGVAWPTNFSSVLAQRTTDGGATWADFDAPLGEPFDLGSPQITAAAVTADGFVLGSTKNRLLFAEDASVVAVTTIDSRAPLGLRLAPARPDPFRGTTALTFDLARAQRVTVTIHDVAGRRVATLANESFAAGRHTLSWDGTDDSGSGTPAGVYFVRAATNDAFVGRRITRIR